MDDTYTGSKTYVKAADKLTDNSSVDLIKMTADQTSVTSSPARSLDSTTRVSRYGVSADHTPQHTCHGCQQCAVYYERNTSTSAARNWPHDEGSIYFNYIQIAKQTPTKKTQNADNVTQSSPSRLSSRPLLGCIRKEATENTRTATTYEFSAPPTNDETDGFAGENIYHDRNCRLNKSRATKTTLPGNKFRRLLIIAAIGSGLVLVLGGIILGLVMLGPLEYSTDPKCIAGYVPCGSKGCVNLRHLCRQPTNECPEVDKPALCSNVSSSRIHQSTSTATTSQSMVKYTVDVEPAVTLPQSTIRPTSPPPLEYSRWVRYNEGSANGSKYTIVNSAMTFYGAQEECRQLGGYLVHVNSIREQVFLMDYLSLKLLDPDISKDGVGFWLGARRARGSHSGSCMYDQWKWVDPHGRQHGVISGFAAFIPGKPDNYFTPEECLYISYNYQIDQTGYFLGWDDAPCDLMNVGGIKVLCEVELRHR